jgi:hypothetical protein
MVVFTCGKPVSQKCFGVQGSGFRVQGSGFRVQGSGFRLSSFWFWMWFLAVAFGFSLWCRTLFPTRIDRNHNESEARNQKLET